MLQDPETQQPVKQALEPGFYLRFVCVFNIRCASELTRAFVTCTCQAPPRPSQSKLLGMRPEHV